MSRDVISRLFTDDGSIPNNPKLPLVLLVGAFEPSPDLPERIERTFRAHGWGGLWRNGVYDFPHYHSTAHEVLGVYRGKAKVLFGGGAGVEVAIQAGDVAVIPAGVGHQCLGASDDFAVIGGYPLGQDHDMALGRPDEIVEARKNIARVPLPSADPVDGASGALTRLWGLRGG